MEKLRYLLTREYERKRRSRNRGMKWKREEDIGGRIQDH